MLAPLGEVFEWWDPRPTLGVAGIEILFELDDLWSERVVSLACNKHAMTINDNDLGNKNPGATPMYEMLLFIYHWGEDFKTKKMKTAFIEKAKALLEREYRMIGQSYQDGKKSSSPVVAKEYYSKSFPMNGRAVHFEDEEGYRDAKFIGLNPEEWLIFNTIYTIG